MAVRVNLKEVMSKGEALPFSWYKYNERYYRIFENQLLAVSNRVAIDLDNNSYKYLSEGGDSVVLVIGRYSTQIVTSSLDSIQAFQDYYYIKDDITGTKKELKYGDNTIVRSDDLYRLSNGRFIGVSNGVHYILVHKDTTFKKIPLGHNKIRYNNDLSIYEELVNDNWIEIKLSNNKKKELSE